MSLWLHFNIENIISKFDLTKINIQTGPGGVFLIRPLPVKVIATCHHTYWQQSHYIRTQFWKRIFIPFEKKTYQLADKIICDCNDTKKILIAHYRISEDKLSVIHCAIDSNKFHPTNSPKNPNCILYLSRIDKRKGLDFLINSMPFVLKKLPEAFLIVGGTGDHLCKMKALARSLGIDQSVRFLGFVPDDQLNELYNQAQCLVVPSVFEGFGITVIEAIAAGTRVIGTDVDGVREILADEAFGRLVPYSNYSAMAEAIVAELQEPKSPKGLDSRYQLDQFRTQYYNILHGEP